MSLMSKLRHVFALVAAALGTAFALPCLAETPYSIPGTPYTGCVHSCTGDAAPPACVGETQLQTCTMRYRPGDDPNAVYDLHLPPDFDPQRAYPLVVAIHGGSWLISTDRLSDQGWVNFTKSHTLSGYLVANLEYTRSPHQGGPYDAGLADIHEFTRMVFDPGIAQVYKIDPSRIVITGISAGAYMALKEATTERPYYAVAVQSTPIDLWDLINPASATPVRFPHSKQTVLEVFGSSAGEVLSKVPVASQLNTRKLFMETSRTDNIVPSQHFETFSAQVACSVQAEYHLDHGAPVQYFDGIPGDGHYMSNPALGDFIARVAPTGSGVVNTKNLNHATSSSALWDVQNLVDRNPGTVYTSYPGSRFNAEGDWVSAYFNSSGGPCPKSVSSITLQARMAGSTPLGFPKAYNLYVTSYNNSSWIFVGSYSAQPTAANQGKVTLQLPGSYRTQGIHVRPTELGVDNYGTYYFQLAEISVR